jgi:hypothetical protein
VKIQPCSNNIFCQFWQTSPMGNTMSLSLGIDATYQTAVSDAGLNLTQADLHNLANAAD